MIHGVLDDAGCSTGGGVDGDGGAPGVFGSVDTVRFATKGYNHMFARLLISTNFMKHIPSLFQPDETSLSLFLVPLLEVKLAENDTLSSNEYDVEVQGDYS